jgi:hypothetical protein
MLQGAAVLLLLSTLNSHLSTAHAQGTAFTYQGQLQNNGSPASGTYALTFALFTTNITGVPIAGPVTNNAVGVTNGLFTTLVDFGPNVFTGSTNWLQIGVATNGVSSFNPLSPRQQLTPTPYAIYSVAAGTAGTATTAGSATSATSASTATTASNFSGPLAGDVTGTQSATVVSTVGGVTAANVAGGANAANAATGANTASTIVKRDASGNFSAGTITANLSGNATTATSATSATTAALANNVVSGIAITNAFITNSVFAGNGAGLTNLNASQLSGSIPGGVSMPAANLTGVIPVAQLPAVVITNDAPSVTIGGTNVVASLTVPPTVPTSSIGSVPTGNGPVSVAVAGRYAYVVNVTADTLQVFDVSTPSVPVSVGSVPTGSNPESVAVAGRYAYVANESADTLQVFDVSTPSAPVSVGSVPTGSSPASVAVAGRYAYVVNYSSDTLQVFDVSSPSSPVSVGSVATGSEPYSVAVAGRYAYVVNYSSDTLQVFDVSTPSAPVSVGSVPTGSSPESVAVAGRYAYVASNGGANTLQVFDVSTNVPVPVGSVGTGNAPSSVAVAGRYAYVANRAANTLQVFDVSTPSAPVSVGSVATGSGPFSVAVSGRYAYVANRTANTLQVFDLGGAYIQQLEAGALETGTLQTRDTVTVGNNLNVRGGLTVSASARISGGLGADYITATNFSGNGGGLTNLNAGSLGGSQLSTVNSQGVLVGTNIYLNNYSMYLRGDQNHGLAYNGAGVTNFPSGVVLPNGPVLWGYSGGALAVMEGGAHAVLTWTNGGVSVTGGFAYSSDRNMKTGFAALDPQEVLARVAALPLSSWFYKTDTGARHVGPMAQDFHAAFALGGGDDKHINVGDEGGVALAAIQGLNQKVETGSQDSEVRMQKLEAENADLKARLEKLEQLVAEKIGGEK